MKKMFFAAVAAITMLAGCGGAMAGTPIVVKDANGAKPTGTAPVIRIEKDTSSGYRVKKLLQGGSTDYATDNANWTVHGKYVTGMYIPVVSGNITFDAAKIKTDCLGNQTAIYAPTVVSTEYITDNCALDTAVRALGQ